MRFPINLLRNRGKGYVRSQPLPPFAAAACYSAVEVLPLGDHHRQGLRAFPFFPAAPGTHCRSSGIDGSDAGDDDGRGRFRRTRGRYGRYAVMRRFYFHVHNDIDAEDEEGVELPDLAAVRGCAVESARALACESIKKGRLNLDHYISVTDEAGREVLKMAFRDCFTLEGASQ